MNALIPFFLASLVLSPWWVVMPLAILTSLTRVGVVVVLLGGILWDSWFGVPIAALYGFGHIYTLIACAIALVSLYLQSRMME